MKSKQMALMVFCSTTMSAGNFLLAHDAHFSAPVFITETGCALTGEAARLEMEERMNRVPETPTQGFASAMMQTEQVPAQAAAFASFAPAVKTRWDKEFFYVESNGLPTHGMMVGITAWQQQVPLPQRYSGENAWRIPLHPVPTKAPLTIKGHFLRGAIAIAVNGIPIFNPQNNRGEISQEIGELDQWGGHCGRADDYHYHVAPLHLQKVLGKDKPVAFALDGYPLYGLTEPDGAVPQELDALHGHSSPQLGYHYHASEKYPYVLGGFHGDVTERGEQVDPQPSAHPVREALPPLRGAKITAFSLTNDGRKGNLVYGIGSKQGSVAYAAAGEGEWRFVFTGPDGAKQERTYQTRDRGGSDQRRDDSLQPQTGPPLRDGENRPPPPREDRNRRLDPGTSASAVEMDALKKADTNFRLASAEIPDASHLPVEFTGDGAGVSPPLSWKGAPKGTKGFVLIMDHQAPDGIKTSWVLYDIPADSTNLPKDVRNVGKAGLSFKGKVGYEPPNSRGPGAKTYLLTLYSLNAPLELKGDATRENVLAAMRGKVLASASLSVTHKKITPPQPGRSSVGPTRRTSS